MTVLLPQSARPESRDNPSLVAARMAAHQHLAVAGVAGRQARHAIVMGRAARHPAAARLSPSEGLGDGLSGHSGASPASEVAGFAMSFAGTGVSARDYSARMALRWVRQRHPSRPLETAQRPLA